MLGRILIEDLPADGGVQHLPQRHERVVAVPVGKSRRPRADLVREQVAHGHITEGLDGLGEHGAQADERGRGGLMLVEVAVDEFGECPLAAGRDERPEPDAVERRVERVARFALRLEAADLAAAAVVAVAVGPRAAAEFVDLATLNARHLLLLVLRERWHLSR
jgi:hypothetical protein